MASHLTLEERDRIAHLRGERRSVREVAEALNRDPATISRELRRNRTGDVYYPAQAQQQSEQRRRERPLARKMDDPEINLFVRSRLAEEWSPEQIEGRMKQEFADEPHRCVSSQTVYTWLEQDEHCPHWQSFLRRRGRRPSRPKNTETGAARIRDRPEIIEQRLRIGDFEGDTVLGPAGTGGIATMVDRKSRFTIIVKVHSKQAKHVYEQVRGRLRELDEDHRHSMTLDNGTEFSELHRLEESLGMKLYFADPGCPHQRGTNENTNGLIRQYFPKGTDFREVSHHAARHVEQQLNNRPRACLEFRTPAEVFFEKTPPTRCD